MKFLDKVAEQEDLRVNLSTQTSYGTGKKEHVIEMEYWSDLGEDCIITLVIDKLTKQEIIDNMEEYADGFDSEEHASTIYNSNLAGKPSSLRALLNDADEQQEKLNHIVETMKALA